MRKKLSPISNLSSWHGRRIFGTVKLCNAYHSLGIDCTVLLTCIGFKEDKQLTAQLDPSLGVDIIIGRHSHTYLKEPENSNGILIVQAGTGTDQIGRFDLEIDAASNSIHSFLRTSNSYCKKYVIVL